MSNMHQRHGTAERQKSLQDDDIEEVQAPDDSPVAQGGKQPPFYVPSSSYQSPLGLPFG